jgi:hypothetical protein
MHYKQTHPIYLKQYLFIRIIIHQVKDFYYLENLFLSIIILNNDRRNQ